MAYLTEEDLVNLRSSANDSAESKAGLLSGINNRHRTDDMQRTGGIDALGFYEAEGGLLNAYNDPNSRLSNQSYYGGSANFANEQRARQDQFARQFANRGGPWVDETLINQGRGFQDQALSGLALASRGDPNSLAQQQLRQGNAMASAQAVGNAAGARGGAVGRALANRSAINQVAANNAALGRNSAELLANEQLQAQGQYAGLVNAMRGQEGNWAQQKAGYEMDQRQLNDAAEMAARERGVGIAGRGMQGAQHRQSMQRQITGTALGLNAAQEQNQIDRAAKNTNTMIGAATGAASTIGSILQNNSGPTRSSKKQSDWNY